MALDQSALTELLDALRSGGDLDFMREAMGSMAKLYENDNDGAETKEVEPTPRSCPPADEQPYRR